MLLVYAFVFSAVFAVRWPNATESFGDFALRLFAGLIPFQFFAEVVNRAPSLVLENATYVKKVVFPLQTLVPTAIVSALFSAGCSYAILAAGYFLVEGLPPLSMLWLPVLWLPLILLTAGIGWALASLGVFLRDLRQLVTIVTSLLIFLTPVFYPLAMVPEAYRPLVLANPLSYLIESMRTALFQGQGPALLPLALSLLAGLAVAQVGYWGFMRTRKAFADVM
ncbi:MAG: ABC transporter permease [Alphaproteobacteria bacterium]|nr:MAG: ABC transporter permease [Alphaproteobacteria bacterium]